MTESGARPAEGQGVKVMCLIASPNSLPYILLCCVRPSVGGGSGPLGTRGPRPVHKELCAVSVPSDRGVARGTRVVSAWRLKAC